MQTTTIVRQSGSLTKLPVIESFQQRGSVTGIEGEVAGLAIPFNVSDERPGLWFDDDPEGKLTFFDYTTYAPQAFDVQLGLPDWGGRVRFMWTHGLEAGMTSIPIGNVTMLRTTTEALMFRAKLGETNLADELRKVVAGGAVKETSVQLRVVDFTFETDEDGKTHRLVTSAELFDVSLVVHGQFPQARLLEVHCKGCEGVPPLPVMTSEELRKSAIYIVDRYNEQGLEPPREITRIASQDEHTPPDAEAVTISKAALGALYAHINDLQETIKLQAAKEVQAC